MGGTVAALEILMPKAVAIVVRADIIVRQHANELRFLIRENAFKPYTLRVATAGNSAKRPALLPKGLFSPQTFQADAAVRPSRLQLDLLRGCQLVAASLTAQRWRRDQRHYDRDGQAECCCDQHGFHCLLLGFKFAFPCGSVPAAKLHCGQAPAGKPSHRRQGGQRAQRSAPTRGGLEDWACGRGQTESETASNGRRLEWWSFLRSRSIRWG
jgi:hypothetical protein